MEGKFLDLITGYTKEGHDIKVETIGLRPCGNNVDITKQKELEDKVRRIVKEHCGIVGFKPGSTDCNIPLSMGIPSVCIGCCDGKGEHTREEFVYNHRRNELICHIRKGLDPHGCRPLVMSGIVALMSNVPYIMLNIIRFSVSGKYFGIKKDT